MCKAKYELISYLYLWDSFANISLQPTAWWNGFWACCVYHAQIHLNQWSYTRILPMWTKQWLLPCPSKDWKKFLPSQINFTILADYLTMPFMQNSEIQKFWSAIRFSSLLQRFNNDKTAYKSTDKQWIFKNPWQVVIMFLTFQLVILLNFFSALCTLEHYSATFKSF